MAVEKLTISLDDFMKYMILNWKRILVVIISTGFLFVLGAKIFGQKIVVEPSERYLELQEQKSALEDYVENSLFMKIDPMNINQRVIYIKNISDRELLKDYIVSGEVWGDIRKEIPSKYLIELVSWNEQDTGETVEIKVSHAEPEMCDKYTEFLAEQIRYFDEKVNVTVGAKFQISEEAVMKEQRRQYKLLDDIDSELEYTAAGYTIEVSLLMSAVVGCMFGMLVTVIVSLFLFIIQEKTKIHRQG